MINSGSPPPMRGKAPAYDPKQANNRITPAYAGKSFYVQIVRGFCVDHPRLCGEKRLLPVSSPLHTGSPPPMRGKGDDVVHRSTRDRITPAYAGKSIEALWDDLRARDHPRLCGEKFQTLFCKIYIPGSPPPMRGKVNVRIICNGVERITPAYAGKSRL